MDLQKEIKETKNGSESTYHNQDMTFGNHWDNPL